MIWEQLLTLILSILIPLTLLIAWFRKEIKAEITEMKHESIKSKDKFDAFREMWAAESKDFHARLYALEKDRK